jgi:hypothetical protein
MKLNKRFVLRKENNFGLVANINTGEIYKLNETAFIILSAISKGKTINFIKTKISNEFTIKKNKLDLILVNFINDLKNKEIIK